MDHKIKNALEGIAPMGISALNETVLSNQPESRYECPVCLNWLRDPVITTCGHKFCKKCITSWLQNSGHCPIDNINLSMKVDIFPDNYTKREIQEQRMSCPFAAKGCSVKVTPLDLDSHISTCEYNQPEASHQPDITIPCSFKAVGCKETFDNQEDLNNHLHNDILSHMSLLMNAYSEIKIDNDISSASLDAKEQEAMSLWEAPDKNDNQTTTPALNNTSALIRALYERVVVLEQRNREQDIVIANISKQLSAFAVAKMKQNNDMLLRYCMGNYIWKIDNFQARLDAMLKDHYKMLYSPGFYTSPNGYRFCVRLNISPQNPQCFALHVHLMKTEYDDCLDWPFNGRIAFSMINQYNPELTQRDTMMSNSSLIAFRKPTAEICLRGFGYTEYALVSDVIRNGFVKDDVLIVKVSIRCV
ncbi:TNF receptor-associated factor 6-A-like isoform X1 [Leptidea sinapis]|uniref:TNF receptor-associated factor 6-A-like isoform X1 n=1 Tax=Leptidea sinapis TaxID=189913 RepID=UPI00212DAD43|nr:TNF receptor-associated factor 6-A-like isoform X1 [Leptidea sinapis]